MGKKRSFSVDWWPVLTALAVVVLIKSGILSHVPW